ncbi:putative lipid II flippase FtsW [uncultured Thomasclavelia sp.]|uniref:putative lipid II flippase FtsW n=1 Tax=uncultured Thomasclavelia sp. TaxID=3025759 RepID=UPI00280AEFED|nr:putative lipid II flippase FtsW [uncultured Thomasclavelia sp.]
MKRKRVVIIVITIVLIGLVMVYSASNIWAGYKYNDSLYYIKRQIIFAVIGIILMFVVSKIDYHIYQKYTNKFLIGTFLLMILVLIPGIGSVRGGSRSWFNLGIISLQPSELFKIAIIIYGANYISNHYHELKKLKASFKLLFILFLGFGLIMLQPDFGSGVVMVCSIIVMLIVSPFPFKYFVMLGIIGVIGIIIMIISAPYRLQRIVAFLNPFADPLGSGFQIIQSLYAIAPGGILGVGYNNSIQKHFYLPEPQTDFIFAIFLEEFGLIGGIVLVGLYGYLFITVFNQAIRVKDLFGSFLMIGIISMIGIQTLINLGVVVGLFPVTGVTLPLMSYGGSSLTITLIAMGIVLNISKSTF